VRPLGTLLILLMLNSTLTALPGIQDQTAAPASESPDSSGRVIDPNKALLLGLIPGGGQIYNRAWLKAILIVAVEGYYFTLFQQNLIKYNDHQDDKYLDLRNKYAWRLLFAYMIGLMDGYVDAHLNTFPPDSADIFQPPLNRPGEDSP
jgi:hypothetical protein